MDHTSDPILLKGAIRAPSVLFVSDVRLYREAVGEGLTRTSGIAFAGHCSGGEACSWLERAAVDIVLIDASLSIALTLARQIRARFPDVRILGLAIAADPKRVLDFAEAGFCGYLGNEVGFDGLVAMINQSIQGEFACSPRISSLLLERVAALASKLEDVVSSPKKPVGEVRDAVLTARETEIASLIDAGLTNKEIAIKLLISAATVKNHVHNILEKLEVPRRAAIRGRLMRRSIVLHQGARRPALTEARPWSATPLAQSEPPSGP